MTITELLADLKAKAKQATSGLDGPWVISEDKKSITFYPGEVEWGSNDAKYLAACSPDRILALVEYVRELQSAAHSFEKDLSEYCDGPERNKLRVLLVGHLDVEEDRT